MFNRALTICAVVVAIAEAASLVVDCVASVSQLYRDRAEFYRDDAQFWRDTAESSQSMVRNFIAVSVTSDEDEEGDEDDGEQ